MSGKYHVPAETSLLAEEVPGTDAEDIPTWNKMQMSDGEPQMGKKLTDKQQTQLVQLLTEYSCVVKDTPGRTNIVEHHILTRDAHPIRLPAYRIPHAYWSAVKAELDNMLKEGINEPATSPWSSPIVLVNKKDKSLRLCVDYRKLNAVSEGNAYPMPRVDDLIDWLGQAKFISALDLSKGYWQVPIAEESKPKTAFITPFCLYQFHVMPFGLQGTPATFQWLMNRALQGLKISQLLVWMTSLFSVKLGMTTCTIYSRYWSLWRVLGLQWRWENVNLGWTDAATLGMLLEMEWCDRRSANWVPYRISQLPTARRMSKFSLACQGIIASSYQIIQQLLLLWQTWPEGALRVVKWTEQCDKAFKKLKEILCTEPVLKSPDFRRPFILQTDASNRGGV